MIGVVFGAMAKAAPERAISGPFGTINALSIAGARDDGSRFVMFSFFGGGLGATPGSDGLSHGNNPISMATIPPAEILEASYPVLFTQWALRPEQRAGRWRGGLGAIYEIEALAETGADVFLLGERGKFPPFGTAGGGAAALNRFVFDTPDGPRTPPLASKIVDVKIRQGDRVRLETPGGGGYGAPEERDREQIARDVRLGYVSAAHGNCMVTAEVDSYEGCLSYQPESGVCLSREGEAVGPHPERFMTSQIIIGVDVGGTFTDLVLFDGATGRFATAKTPARRGDKAEGFLTGLESLGRIADFAAIVHGTTVGTNALLERKGARVGLIATPGFRDVLEMHQVVPHLGPERRLSSGRRTRSQRRSWRANARRWDDPGRDRARRGRGPGARTRRARRRGAGDRVRQLVRQSRQRARRGGGRPRGLAE